MTNCPTCTGKKWLKSDKKASDGRRYWKCWRCGELQLEPRPFLRQSPEILYLDIETSFTELLNFGLKVPSKYISPKNLLHESYIIAWAASWVGKDKVYSGCVTQEDALRWTDENILMPLWKLIDRADIVSCHNAKFDIPRINARFVLNGFDPIFPKIIDTLVIAHRMKFESSTLEYLCKKFGINGKDAMCAEDWHKIATSGDPKSLRKMKRYNIKDVSNGKKLLERMIDWSGKRMDLYAQTFSKEPRDSRDIIDK